LPRDSELLRSSFQDDVALKDVALSISSTSPAIGRAENKVHPATGPYVEASLSMTLFPLSENPLSKNVTFTVSESNLGYSAVAWPLYVPQDAFLLKPFLRISDESFLQLLEP
jgi:hypothetical protein